MEVATPYEGICDIPVIFWKPEFRTRNFPSVIVFTLAIGWYYLNGLFRQGGATALYALVPFFFVIALAGGQTYVIAKQPQCPPVPWWGFLGAWIIGIVAGTVGYWSAAAAIGMNKAIVPTVQIRQGFTTENFSGATDSFIFSGNSSANAGPETSMANIMSSSSGGEKCAAPLANADQTFVVDLYKNGKLITQAIGE